MRIRHLVIAAALCAAHPAAADEPARSATVSALESGALADGAATLTGMIAADGANADARFGLGLIEFVQGVEHLSQGLYRYGLQPPRSFLLPIVRLPVPENPNPEPIDYDAFRRLLATFESDLAKAEATLAGVTAADDVKIRLNLIAVRYDADGNGTVGPDEVLVGALGRFLAVGPEELAAEPFHVAFDAADAYWLRGYSNVLMALTNFLLAHDWRESFDVSFHVFFPRAHSEFQTALAGPDDSMLGSEVAIADLISFLHIRWPVAEPARMAAVRTHLKQMVALSRENWAAILAETDDDAEWVPGPGQSGATGATVSREQVDAWYLVLDEVEALLDGTKLMPHWRFDAGINFRRVFEEPRPFDLVLWITGPSALPYLENGDILTSAEWEALTSAFQGEFGSYAIWFN